mgnify:FL=1
MAKELYVGYEAEIREYRIAFSLSCAYTGIALILFGAGLDYGLYPHLQVLFGKARVLVSILIFGIILLMKTK